MRKCKIREHGLGIWIVNVNLSEAQGDSTVQQDEINGINTNLQKERE